METTSANAQKAPVLDSLQAFEAKRQQNSAKNKNSSLLTAEERGIKSAGEHTVLYDRILQCYTEHAEKSLRVNRRYKRWYFYGSVGVMLGMALLMGYLILSDQSSGNVAEYVTGISAFVTAYIVLPVTITKYLFNPDESKNLNAIVQSIQQHDLAMLHKPPLGGSRILSDASGKSPSEKR